MIILIIDIIISYDQNISLIFYVNDESHVRLRHPSCVYISAQRQSTAVLKMCTLLKWLSLPYILDTAEFWASIAWFVYYTTVYNMYTRFRRKNGTVYKIDVFICKYDEKENLNLFSFFLNTSVRFKGTKMPDHILEIPK